ncbi:MAG: hypothetical protein QF893_07520 [Alphaproteobacteria bacterium]|nr:hypothetical protein [Alphaproteobacteria bacterium]
MPKVTCPICGSVAIAVPAATTTEIRGATDVARCERLRPLIEAGVAITDLMECEELERAVELALGVTDAAVPVADALP